MDSPRIYRLSETALTVELGNRISLETNNRVLGLQQALLDLSPPGLVEMVPAYTTLTIYFEPLSFQDPAAGMNLIQSWEERIRLLLRQAFQLDQPEEDITDVPVCYHETLAPDLEWVASACGLSVRELIRIHASVIYRVYMTGFVPGFPYMGITDARLDVPRKQIPRQQVAAGSVALAGRQTGIYPLETPGGWQVIGRTPMKLFDPGRVRASLFRAGMNVRFVPMSLSAFTQFKPDEN